MSQQIPDPYFQRKRSAVTGQVVGVTINTLQLQRSFQVVASQLVSVAINFTLAPPTNVAVQNGPDETPSLVRAVVLLVAELITVSASLVATPGSEPVIDGPNESPALGVLVEVAVV